MANKIGKDHYSVKEAAIKLGVVESTVRKNIDSGVIKAKKVLNRWRIPASEIDRLLDFSDI